MNKRYPSLISPKASVVRPGPPVTCWVGGQIIDDGVILAIGENRKKTDLAPTKGNLSLKSFFE